MTEYAYGASEARQRFCQLITAAACRGDRISILKHGQVVAAIVPVDDLVRLGELPPAPPSPWAHLPAVERLHREAEWRAREERREILEGFARAALERHAAARGAAVLANPVAGTAEEPAAARDGATGLAPCPSAAPSSPACRPCPP